MLSSLYNTLIENISNSIKLSLNEMSKKIDHRNIDRKLWLSVASVCSRNKATEAEFVKPMKKLNKDDLLERYVAGLIIMKKPCPKSEKDIESLKTLKLFALKALELGATILNIQDLYNINSGISTTPVKQTVLKKESLFKDDIFNDEHDTDHIISDKLEKESITYKINKQLKLLEKSVLNNNPAEFVTILNNTLDMYDTERYNKNHRLWSLYVGYDETWSPTIERTEYRNCYQNHYYDGYFSYENKAKVVKDGENLFNAMDRAVHWKLGYDYWSRYDCNSKIVFKIYKVNDEDKDELAFAVSINTGNDCKLRFINVLKQLFTKACEKLDIELEARDKFDSSKYGFDKEPSNYVDWVSSYLPVILKNNGIDGKDSWYSGINIKTANCEFYTGSLETCTPDGIIYWMSGDSTDAEGKISYSEWRNRREYYEYDSHADVSIRIDYNDKTEFSKQIYNYIKKLVQNGKLK